jgi:hypothetical protein
MNNFMALNSGRIRVEFTRRSLPAEGGADWKTKENYGTMKKNVSP